jgi:hypothetical protein
LRALALSVVLAVTGCASTEERDLPACLSKEAPVPELRVCIDEGLAPFRSARTRAYERAEAKYENDPAMLKELEIMRKVRDLDDHVHCVSDAEIAAERKAEASGTFSKLESARLAFACQRRRMKQRIDALDRL